MATSPNRGSNSSSLARPDPARALARLRELSLSPTIQKLCACLGADELFLVGGTVRDTFYDSCGADIDLACALPLHEFSTRLTSAGIRVVETGIKHGTLTTVVDQTNCEITAFRNQRDPKVPDLQSDLEARDFTINAMAFTLTDHRLVDPFGGRSDLEKGALRSPGPAQRCFADDPLRILRMIRFGPACARACSADLLEEAKLQAARLLEVKVERIRAELERILLSPQAAQGFRQMLELGLLPFTLPEMLDAVGVEQNEFHIHDVFEHTLWVLERCRPDLLLRLTAVFHDLGKPAALSIAADGRRHFYKHEHISAQICKKRMAELKFSNHAVNAVTRLVELHMRPLDCGPAGVRRLMRDLGEDFELWKEFKRADAPPVATQPEIERAMQTFEALVSAEQVRLAKAGGSGLKVNGEDLKAIGIAPGRGMGEILKALEELVIENPDLNDRDALLQRAAKLHKI